MDAAASSPPSAEEPDDTLPDLFGTETVAELFARQGRLGEAVAIYQRLLAKDPGDARREKWLARVAELQQGSGRPAPGSASGAARRPSSRIDAAVVEAATAATPGGGEQARTPPAPAPMRLPVVVRQAVRGGQIVYAEARDLIVLAPTNPGGELLADGNIHVYAPLRGRAIAGAQGCAQAQIFCQRLEAELVGIGEVLLSAEQIPAERWGKPARVFLEHGRCVIVPL